LGVGRLVGFLVDNCPTRDTFGVGGGVGFGVGRLVGDLVESAVTTLGVGFGVGRLVGALVDSEPERSSDVVGTRLGV